MKRIILAAEPRGMCGGVRKALAAVENALRSSPKPVWVLHEIVHNTVIVESLRARGVNFAGGISEVPDGATLIFSAHGVGADVEAEAGRRRLTVIDATCPLVKRIHEAMRDAGRAGKTVILIGHRGHPEVEGTLGRAEGPVFTVETPSDVTALPAELGERELALLTQTTLDAEKTAELTAQLRRRFPRLRPGRSICDATARRQEGIRRAASRADLTIVLGSAHSSNSQRLREVAERAGCPAILVDTPEQIPPEILRDARTVAVSAGASVPVELEKRLFAYLRAAEIPVEHVPPSRPK